MISRRTGRAARVAASTAIALLISWLAVAAAPSVVSARSALASGLLPPAHPSSSLAVAEYMWTGCTGARDFSTGCLKSSLAMLNAGRRAEGLGPLLLPSNWQRLTVAEQLFVLSELERTARGLPADTGLAADWNAAAQAGADAGQDPTRGGSGARGFQAVWAGGEPNAIVVVADWIYADGVFPDGTAQNLGCSLSDPSGCWSHRDILLHDTAATSCHARCAVGAGFSASGFTQGGSGAGRGSYAEIFGIDGGNSSDPLIFTWAAERSALPTCERLRDSCGWAGVPVATRNGIATAGTSHGSTGSAPFAVGFRSHVSSAGRVNLAIRVAARLRGVSAVAHLGRRHVRLRVRRRSRYVFRATGRLTPGRWTVAVRYRTARRPGLRPLTRLHITVPAGA